MVKWANDGLFQANASKTLVNNTLVNDSEMRVNELTSIVLPLAWSKQ